jgi:hypothetical protein
MRTILVGLALVASVTMARANPVLRPAFDLSSENVTITVSRSESRITGDYTFRSRGPNPRRFTDEIWLDLPVSMPTNGMMTAAEQRDAPPEQVNKLIDKWLDLVKPNGTLDKKDFSLDTMPSANYLTRQVESQLPPGWGILSFWTRLYADACRPEVKLYLTYIQPHLPGNISAYLPILWGADKSGCLITFKVEDGGYLTRLGNYEVVGNPTDTSISVRPAHLQLLQVQVK